MKISTNFVPVGTVVAYAGDVNKTYESLLKQGWMVCDGRELEQIKYPELFANIGKNFGKRYDGVFNIPDLRGLFVRGVTGPSSNDPNAQERTALMDGGNQKNEVGSYQGYATASPKTPFTASITNNNIEARSLDSGCNTAASGTLGGADTGGFTNGTGGDLETRPINKYVYYLIKCSELDQNNEAVVIPVGSIIPFSGQSNTNLKNQYFMCNGDSFPTTNDKFEKLFAVIGYIHGKTGDYFNLPDYRGFFLRGVDDQAAAQRRDPDADKRTPPLPNNPEGEQGNSGNKVGSVQNDATAYPVSSSFFTKVPYLPTSEKNNAISGAVKDAFKWDSGSVTAEVTTGGGDTETRPINVCVDWYIKY